MFIRRPLLLLVLAGSALLGAPLVPAVGPPENPVLRGPSNAALAYWRTWDVEQAEDLFIKAGEQYKAADCAWRPDADLSKLLNDHAGLIRQLIESSQIPACDWGVEYGDGYMALLPHLGKLRRSVRVLASDARLRLAEGDAQAAADRITAIFRMAEHLKSDRLPISALVAASIATIGCDELACLAQSGKLDAGMKRSLLAVCRELSDEDPFGARAGWVNERDMFTGWIDATYTGEEAGKALIDGTGDFWKGEGNKDRLDRIRGMDEAALKEVTEQARRFYDDCLKHWDSPDPKAGFAQAERKLESGGYGPLAELIGPSMTKFRGTYDKARQRLDQAMQILST